MKKNYINAQRSLKQSQFSSQVILESTYQQPSMHRPLGKQGKSQILSSNPSTLQPPSQQELTPYLRKSTIIQHNHTKTVQLLNQSRESQFYSDDSENDLFRESQKEKPQSAVHFKSRSKILNQMAYITQKMMPEYEKDMKLISQAENKVIDFGADKIEIIKPVNQSLFTYGEVPIVYLKEKQPIELLGGTWNVQELRQMEFYYYKIRSKGQMSPLQFQMTQSQQTNFKIFVSSVNPFPTKFSCDQIVSVKGWKYKFEDQKHFTNEYIYLSLVCDLDNEVKLKFQFGSDTVRKTTQKQSNHVRKQSNNEFPFERLNSDLLKMEVAEIKKRRKLKMLQLTGGVGKDLIKANIKNVSSFQESLQRSFREFKKYQQDTRIEDVLERKRYIEIQDQKGREMKSAYKTIQRTLKLQETLNCQKKALKNKVCENWFNILFVYLIGQKILQVFLHKIDAIKEATLMAFQVQRIMRRIHKRLSESKGVTIQDRVYFDSKLCLTMFCNQVYEKQEKQFIQGAIPQLRKRAYIYNFKAKVIQTSQKIHRIRNVFKEFLDRYKLYKQGLHNSWTKHFAVQFQKYFEFLDSPQEGPYQQWFLQAQSYPLSKEVQDVFCRLFSKDRLRKFIFLMHQYSKNLKQLKNDKYKKNLTQRNIFADIRNIRKPRLFIVPTQEDIFHYIPKVFDETKNSVKARKQLTIKITKQ